MQDYFAEATRGLSIAAIEPPGRYTYEAPRAAKAQGGGDNAFRDANGQARTKKTKKTAPFVSFWYLLGPAAGWGGGGGAGLLGPAGGGGRNIGGTAVAAAARGGTGCSWWAAQQRQQQQRLGAGPASSKTSASTTTASPAAAQTMIHTLGSLPMQLRDSRDPGRVRPPPIKGPKVSRDGRPLCRQCGQVVGCCKHTRKE